MEMVPINVNFVENAFSEFHKIWNLENETVLFQKRSQKSATIF